MALSRFVLTADVTVPWPGAAVLETTPAVPASNTPQFNPNGFPVQVTVSGGTVTVIAVNGAATGQTSGTVTVPTGGTITLTYSVAPTWTWVPFGATPAGYQTRFTKGSAIYADNAGAPFSTGPQQLFQAIGAGNLRAFVQGQDDVGHAGLSN
jgi:hypothetical protein